MTRSKKEKVEFHGLKDGFLPVPNVIGWLRSISGTGKEVLVPVDTDGKVGFEPISKVKDAQVLLKYANSHRPPKGLVFPQNEVFLKYETSKAPTGTKGKLKVKEVRPQMAETVLFGIRPCDARALAILDKVFSAPNTDVYYWDRRTKVALVGMACTEPAVNCFCTSVGGDPAGTEGLDVRLTEVWGGYYVEALTKKGVELLSSPEIEAVKDGQREKAETVHKEAHKEFARSHKGSVIEPKEMAQLLTGKFDDPYWDEVARKCIGCGACTYLCPTCHCFDISDEGSPTKGRRVRTWDTCQFADFTLHTSGHNPRPLKKSRIRQRVFHKFKYMPENLGTIGCVGCGRCISMCPMNMDIFKVIFDMKDSASKPKEVKT